MLTRRGLLLSAAGAAILRGGRIFYRDYSRCLPDYLRELAQDAYSRRNEAISKLTTPAAIQSRQSWVRETFWKLTGGMPERTPLQTRKVGTFERAGYRVEKIVYQSRPGLYVPANLYLPASGKPPYPGVLFQMGHSLNGKAAEPYQRCCQGLARLGYVVLAFDPMGQGERTYYPRPGGTLTRLNSADTEHTLPGRQMLLVGDTATRFQVWDAVRSLDVLAAHPMVDPKRLASTGQSGGGTLTMLLVAVDDRLAAAAVSCGNTENFACADFNPPGSTDDAEQDFIASGAVAFDRWDLLYPMAPKPLLVLASARDYFGTYSPRYLSSGREEFEKLRKVYAALGAQDRIAWDETPAPHALAYFLRTRIYAWFERWLHDRPDRDVPEPEVAPEKDETLWMGATGNVVRDFSSKTPLTLVRERVRIPEKAPDLREVARLIAAETPRDPKALEIARVPSEACDIAAIEVETVPRVYAPAWFFAPRKSDPSKPALLMLEPGGRSARWGEGGLCHQLAARGVAVCAADLRGIGDASPEASRGNLHFALSHAGEESYAWASLILGKPLIGQRVTDIVALVRAMGSLDAMSGRRIVVAALGTMTVPALFAAALEPRIDRLYLAGGLVSFESLLDFEEYRHSTANFVPGILNVCDLPALAAAVSPRRIVLAGPVDGAGAPMPQAEVQRRYMGVAAVEIRPEPSWDAGTLAAL
jgi:cephalosporin-C deacetylase-like acetyl esterase